MIDEKYTIHYELKKAIVNWLMDNRDTWQRVNACTEEFRAYIYNSEGNYLIGGREVAEFIDATSRLIERAMEKQKAVAVLEAYRKEIFGEVI